MIMEKISPDKYREILEGIDLQSLSIKSLKASIDHNKLSEGMKITIEEDASYNNEDEGFTVENRYILYAKNKERKIA